MYLTLVILFTSREHVLPGYDPDDPLADLGLTDEEELQPKKKSPHKKPLSRRLSNEKLKIQPSVDYDDNGETPNKNKLGRNTCL